MATAVLTATVGLAWLFKDISLFKNFSMPNDENLMATFSMFLCSSSGRNSSDYRRVSRGFSRFRSCFRLRRVRKFDTGRMTWISNY